MYSYLPFTMKFIMQKKPAFTLIEVLLTVTIIAVLVSIILMSISPRKTIIKAQDAHRLVISRNLKSALLQYSIDNHNFPVQIPQGEHQKKQICSFAATDTVDCINLNQLAMTNYITTLTKDDAETNANFLGYSIYKADEGMVYIEPLHLGKIK